MSAVAAGIQPPLVEVEGLAPLLEPGEDALKVPDIAFCGRPNPALKGTPRVRGFATAPGSPLACIR